MGTVSIGQLSSTRGKDVAFTIGLEGDDWVGVPLDGSNTGVPAEMLDCLARDAARAAINTSPQAQATIADEAAASPIQKLGERLEKSTRS